MACPAGNKACYMFAAAQIQMTSVIKVISLFAFKLISTGSDNLATKIISVRPPPPPPPPFFFELHESGIVVALIFRSCLNGLQDFS